MGVSGDIDCSFLLLVAAAAAREIAAGRNWKNLPIVGLVTVFAAGNIAFHIEAHIMGTVEYAARFGLAIPILLISLVGGRIIPSFTRNWLVRENPGRVPVRSAASMPASSRSRRSRSRPGSLRRHPL